MDLTGSPWKWQMSLSVAFHWAKVSNKTKPDVNGTSVIRKLSGRELIQRVPTGVTENIFEQ